MKILTYKQVNEEYENLPFEAGKKRDIAEKEICEKLEETLKKYNSTDSYYVFRRAKIMARVIISFEDKRILDLGCGSKDTPDNGDGFFVLRSRMFEPWICRGLYELGINVVGIDICDNSEEEFENYRIDLTEENCLSFIPTHSIDVAHSCMLFSSPIIWGRGQSLKDNLIPQLERIVKPEGFFIYEE